jgi:2-polyprenyl-3-methyl-5-hydroxy-6-metoxy-1,4-benzoquinol methylase
MTTERFAFGKNWQNFLATIDAPAIELASASFRAMLGDRDWTGRSMLDVGCGSGLSSLVARRMGMSVRAFDYDPESVACAVELKRRFASDDRKWLIERGDALDDAYMEKLGTFDLVYSWGVLHHTGDMWRALLNVVGCVAPGGTLFIAIYNDQGGASRRWLAVKRLYQRLPSPLKPMLVAACMPKLWGKTLLRDSLHGNPLATWRSYGKSRGMSPWHDMVDWVGGYPFQVAKPEEIIEFYQTRGFALDRLQTAGGGLGCNQFVFRKL